MGHIKVWVFGFLVLGSKAQAGDLFAKEAPRAERQKALAVFFEPTFAEELTFDKMKLLNYNKGEPFESLTGTIVVKPPKGKCFAIELQPDFPDQKFCKEGLLRFS